MAEDNYGPFSAEFEKPTVSESDLKTLVMLPCPFCGGDANTFDAYCPHRCKKIGITAYCPQCNIGTIYKDLTEDEAINAWNKRAS